jgi:hypothetical protein
MTRATLAIRHEPGPDDRVIVIDCPHGTTTVALLNPAAAGLGDAYGVVVCLAEHDAQEGCGCTAHLWRRYGVREGSP